MPKIFLVRLLSSEIIAFNEEAVGAFTFENVPLISILKYVIMEIARKKIGMWYQNCISCHPIIFPKNVFNVDIRKQLLRLHFRTATKGDFIQWHSFPVERVR